MKFRKRYLFFLLLIPIIIVIAFFADRNIPFLPIDYKSILKIQIKDNSIVTIATDSEKKAIYSFLNSTKTCDYKILIPIYGNGKPSQKNIQIFTKNQQDGNYCYIEPYNNDSILISKPQSGVGYIIKTAEFQKYFK